MRNVNLAHGSIYLLGGYFGYKTVDATGSWLFSFVVAFIVAALLGVILQVAGVPPHGGAGSSPDAGDDRHFDRARRPHALGLRRRLLSDPDADLAARAGAAALRHGGQVLGRSGLSAISDRAARHLRRFRRHRPRDVARPQSHPDRHDRARRRRRSRYAVCDGRAASSSSSSSCSRSARASPAWRASSAERSSRISPGEDTRFLLASLVVVIVGGMGSIPGAALGAVHHRPRRAIGLVYFPTYAIVLTFLIMVLVLAVRPQGLLARR